MQEALRGTPVGKDMVTNYRGLPAVAYHQMADFELQQEVCAKAGVTGRIISTPFAAEVMAAISKSPSLDICKATSTTASPAIVARAPGNWGMGTLNPLDRGHIAEAERCFQEFEIQGPADLLKLARPLH